MLLLSPVLPTAMSLCVRALAERRAILQKAENAEQCSQKPCHLHVSPGLASAAGWMPMISLTAFQRRMPNSEARKPHLWIRKPTLSLPHQTSRNCDSCFALRAPGRRGCSGRPRTFQRPALCSGGRHFSHVYPVRCQAFSTMVMLPSTAGKLGPTNWEACGKAFAPNRVPKAGLCGARPQ